MNNIGKYKFPFFFTFSVRTLKKINSYINSIRLCHAFGTNFAPEQARLYRVKASKQLISVKRVEFVKDRSIIPKLIGIIFNIANCSSGEKYIDWRFEEAKKGFEPLTFCG